MDPMLNDPLAVWIAAAWLAVLFAHAGIAKLADRPLWSQHLAAYLSGLRWPAPLQALLSAVLPLLEIATAVALLSPWRAIGAMLAAALLLAYGGAMAWHLARGHRLDCGCGGEPLPVSWVLVARNAALALLAPLAAQSVDGRALGAADFAVVAASVPLAALLYAAVNQLLRHQVGARIGRV